MITFNSVIKLLELNWVNDHEKLVILYWPAYIHYQEY